MTTLQQYQEETLKKFDDTFADYFIVKTGILEDHKGAIKAFLLASLNGQLEVVVKTLETDFIEKGADLEHDRWSRWQKYFFSKCLIKPQHEVGGMDDRHIYFALAKDLYQRWNRQIETVYSNLSEEEKESDRKETRNYLPLLTIPLLEEINKQ